MTHTVASLFVRTSPLAVITVAGLLDILMVSNSAESRSFLLTLCIFAPESTTNSLSSRSFVDAAGRTHFSAGEKNVVLSFALSFVNFSGKIPSLALGAQLLSSSLLLRPILKFHSVGTALMRNFDLFLQAMVLCFLGYLLDVAKTVCIELVGLIPKLYVLGVTRYFTLFGSPDGSESCETHPTAAHFFLTIATAPLS